MTVRPDWVAVPRLMSDDLVNRRTGVAVRASELDEFACPLEDSALWRCAGNGYAAPASELEQSFVAQLAQRPEDGVGVHTRTAARSEGPGQPKSRPRRRAHVRVRARLSEYLGLRAFELFAGKHAAVSEVGELAEIIRRPG